MTIQPGGICAACGHEWLHHTAREGCLVHVDSAYTVTNSRGCGCQARSPRPPLDVRESDEIMLLVWAEWAKANNNEGAERLFRRVVDRLRQSQPHHTVA